MSSIAEILKECRTSMDKAVESSRREFNSIRGGKASSSLLDTVRVEAYGQSMPMSQVASVSAPEPRLLLVTPWDKGLAQAIEKAIRDSDLGLNPASQGTVIRVPLPMLSEERRRDLVKIVHKLAEEGKIAIRHARTDMLSKVKKLEKIPEDDKSRAEKEAQKLTDEHVRQVDQLVAAKEAEIMEV
jgi:ribosome recycling factor